MQRVERGGSHVHPSVLSVNYDASPIEGLHTATECALYAVEHYQDEPSYQFRRVSRFHDETVTTPDGVQKPWRIPEFGPVRTRTYREWGEEMVAFGDGLVRFAHLQAHDFVGMYLDTRYEWLLGAHSCWRHSLSLVTAFATLGIDNLVKIINECELKVMITSGNALRVLESIKDRIPTLEFVVCVPDFEIFESERFRVSSGAFRVTTFEHVVRTGQRSVVPDEDLQFPRREDLALVMYTSGTTGDPKGVMIQHQNLVAAMHSAAFHFQLGPGEVHLAYLPLAHIFEQAIENAAFCSGALLAYGTPKTLSDVGARPMGDLAAFRPTVMLGVPRVFDTMRKKIQNKISEAGAVSRYLFNWAYQSKLQAIYDGTTTSFWDWLVFGKFVKAFGGRLRVLASGAAPLSRETHEFLQCLLSPATIFAQGYGATETCACGCGRDPMMSWRPENLGVPIDTCELKLVSVPDMGYNIDDEPCERGEILIRGPTVCTLGYYKRPKETREAFDEDGWYHTGDIAKINEDETFVIIDRKKNFMKLPNGEFITPEPLQTDYGVSSFVAPNGICCIADPYHNSLTAIIVPERGYVARWAAESGGGLEEMRFEEQCETDELKAAILEDFKRIADQGKKRRYEYVKDIHITPDEWTPESGLVNSTQKLRRNVIRDHFIEQIAAMYEGLD